MRSWGMAISSAQQKYPYTVQTELLYKDEPQGKAFKALQPDTVDLKVEGTGWQLLLPD